MENTVKTLRLATTGKLHQKAHRLGWYRDWHTFRYHHHLHWAILVIYILSALSVLLQPTNITYAELTQASKTISTQAEFSQGTITGDAQVQNVSGGEMNLQVIKKKIVTGSSSTNGVISAYGWLKGLVRDSHGGLHITWIDQAANPRVIYYSSSSDNGTTWAAATSLGTSTVAEMPTILIDGNDRVHVLWYLATPDYAHYGHRYKDYGGSWSGTFTVGAANGSDEVQGYLHAPIDQSNNIQLFFNRAHYQGIGQKTFSSVTNTWGATTGTLNIGSIDTVYQNTIVDGTNYYHFYQNCCGGNGQFYFVRKYQGAWGTPTQLTSFTNGVTYHNEVKDSQGNIWFFASENSGARFTIKAKKYVPSTDTWDANWTDIDSDPAKHVYLPSSTVDSSGKIWLFYNIGSEIFFKTYSNSTWSSRAQITSNATDGDTYYPKVKFQEYFNNSPDNIELTYRQNPTGNTSTYYTYYASLGGTTTGQYLSPSSGANTIKTSWNGGWQNTAFNSNVNIQTGTSISYEIRSGSGPDNSNITWNNWQSLGSIDSSSGTGDRAFSIAGASMPNEVNLPIGDSMYIQVRVSLNSTSVNYPLVYDYSLNYLTDTNAPTNPASASAWTDAGKGTPVNDNTWHNNTSIYLEWPAGTDAESGLKGYYVYFGTDNTAMPYTAGVWQTGLTKTASLSPPDSGKDHYLRIQTEDNAGNRSAAVTLFTYRFDATAPANPSTIERNPVGWSNVNSFSFTWTAGADTANAFGNSGVAGYEYKRATDANWNSTTNLTVSGIQAYQNGTNVFYVRTKDNAGNVGDSYTQINYYYSLDAPSAPQNLSVTPNNNTENAFSFSWTTPATFNGTIKGYRWSVNAVPSANNTVYTTLLTTGIIPAATQQGLNTFYVVAIDNTDNVNYANYDSIQFEANTTAPGAPGSPTISDISNRDSSNWALALSWQAPQTGGTVDHYIIERSLDNSNFSQTGTSSTTTFAESGLDNTQLYYYRIIAVDNAASLSAPSTVVSKQPTGKFTIPPRVVTGPDASATAIGAVITWSTDRASSSFVEYGKDTNYGLSNGSLEPMTSHSVTVSGLNPGTTYHFRVQSLDDQRDYDPTSAYSSDYTFTTSAAPGISEVKISDVRLDSAIVTWKTTSSATSNIKYGKTNTYGKEIVDSSGSSVTTHTIKLTELDHSSTYHFKITGTDIDNNYMQSDDYSFETLTYPRVSNVRFEQQKNTATSTLRVTWTSNVPLTSIVEYREGTSGKVAEVSKSGLIVSHDILAPGLRDNTEYYMVVKGRDAYGNEAVSDTNKVKTDYDTRPPEISEITTESSISGYGLDTKAQVIVSWFTDEPSTSQVEYAEGVSGETFSSKTPQDTSLTTSHVVVISDLKPSASYYFRVISRDSAKNESLSETNSVLTEQARSSVIDVIIKSFESTLGWLLKVGR